MFGSHFKNKYNKGWLLCRQAEDQEQLERYFRLFQHCRRVICKHLRNRQNIQPLLGQLKQQFQLSDAFLHSVCISSIRVIEKQCPLPMTHSDSPLWIKTDMLYHQSHPLAAISPRMVEWLKNAPSTLKISPVPNSHRLSVQVDTGNSSPLQLSALFTPENLHKLKQSPHHYSLEIGWENGHYILYLFTEQSNWLMQFQSERLGKASAAALVTFQLVIPGLAQAKGPVVKGISHTGNEQKISTATPTIKGITPRVPPVNAVRQRLPIIKNITPADPEPISETMVTARKPKTSSPASYQQYTIKSGDTLYGIAEKVLGNGNHWQQLYKLNQRRIRSVRDLQVGQVLLLPTSKSSDTQTQTTAYPTYTIQAGDTLYSIAQKSLGNGLRWSEIQQLNRYQAAQPSQMKIGAKLKLPLDAKIAKIRPSGAALKPSSSPPIDKPIEKPVSQPTPTPSPVAIPSPKVTPIPQPTPTPIVGKVSQIAPPPSVRKSEHMYPTQFNLYYQPTIFNESISDQQVAGGGQISNGMGVKVQLRPLDPLLLEGEYNRGSLLMNRPQTNEQTQRTVQQATLGTSYVHTLVENKLEAKAGIKGHWQSYAGETPLTETQALREKDFFDGNHQTLGVGVEAGLGYKPVDNANWYVHASAKYSPYTAVFQDKSQNLGLPDAMQSVGGSVSTEFKVSGVTIGVNYDLDYQFGGNYQQMSHQFRVGAGYAF